MVVGHCNLSEEFVNSVFEKTTSKKKASVKRLTHFLCAIISYLKICFIYYCICERDQMLVQFEKL